MGPHVVDDQQHALLGECRAKSCRCFGRRPDPRPGTEPGQEVELQGQHVRPLADRHPVHTVREPAADPVVGRQGGGEHRLADPADPVQADAGGLAGEADGAAGRGADDGVDQPVQLVAHHVARRQRRHAGEHAGDLASGTSATTADGPATGGGPAGGPSSPRGSGLPCGTWVDEDPEGLGPGRGPAGAGGRSCAGGGTGKADGGSTAPTPAAANSGAGITVRSRSQARWMRRSRSAGFPACSPRGPSRPGSCSHCTAASSGAADQKQSPMSTGASITPRGPQCGQLVVDDVVRRQEVSAHEHQRDPAASDRLLDLRMPLVTDPDSCVIPQPKVLAPDERLQQYPEALGPGDVVVAVAEEHQAVAVGAVTRCDEHPRIISAVG